MGGSRRDVVGRVNPHTHALRTNELPYAHSLLQNSMTNEASSNSIHVSHPWSGDGGRGCGRRNMAVDFRALGWHAWIVAPATFNAFYCAGTCPSPLAPHLAGSNHARLQALLHSLLPGGGGVGGNGGVPSPCCVPQGLDGVTILMVDEMDRFVLRTFPELVVTSCTCQ
ncbi:hypothetical protein Pcinc_008393 [Petrolisthes cinctipes]|uniref:TGF-beta family profile domain-containing protein n=1 Tax=Petrolisthes cinctipes TaxID=88211 RepID=A0AAE1KWH9_PETCI|nr:hypothetical protein Pcinc_008393 [Petrolisthes cinctipes]